MIWSGTRKFGKFEIVTKIYIFAESEDYIVALYQVKIVATYGKRRPVENKILYYRTTSSLLSQITTESVDIKVGDIAYFILEFNLITS